MIHESRYWKNDLLRSVDSLQKRMSQQRWHEATFARVERDVMIGFYTLRKLIEAHKIDDKTASSKVSVTTYPAKGKCVTRINWIDWWELYNLEAPTSEKIDLLFLCHQFIHSYVFSCEFSESREFVGILVSSDRRRNRALYSVAIKEIIKVFKAAGSSYPNEIRMKFNIKKSDYDVIALVSDEDHMSHD